MFKLKMQILLYLSKRSQYPVTGLPEVAFVGRSNVGNSIINAITNRRKLKVSKPQEKQD